MSQRLGYARIGYESYGSNRLFLPGHLAPLGFLGDEPIRPVEHRFNVVASLWQRLAGDLEDLVQDCDSVDLSSR